MHVIGFDGTYAGWKKAARQALALNIPPTEIDWRSGRDEQETLGFASDAPEFALEDTTAELAGKKAGGAPTFRVPREFAAQAPTVACHSAPGRWALLYRLVWRCTHGEPHLLEVSVDPDVREFSELERAVRRDVHKMRAFVRFREVATEAGPWFVAWFEPAHDIVEFNARFFVERFAAMRWSILTPKRCAHWDGAKLTFTPGASRTDAPAEDAKEDLWRTYYASIFNPARLKPDAMRNEMPERYWKNLPEAEVIPGLIAAAPARASAMIVASAAARPPPETFGVAPVPDTAELDLLRDAAATCRACPLWRSATCTVFGAGPPHARIVVVGEQPGDQEDRAGVPFVGPAGQLFDRALREAGVDRGGLYVTNAVKHFKWTPQGKRRLHQKPNAREIAACRPWLVAELRALQPDLIVCLGGTAAGSVLQRPVKVLSERGTIQPGPGGVPMLVTLHPSALLRMPDEARAKEEFAAFVADLRKMK